MNINDLLKKIEAGASAPERKARQARPARKAPLPEEIRRTAILRATRRATATAARPVCVWLVYSDQICRGCGRTHASVSPQLFVEFVCPARAGARALNWKRPTPEGLIPPALPRRVLQHPPHDIEACPACFEGEASSSQLELFPGAGDVAARGDATT